MADAIRSTTLTVSSPLPRVHALMRRLLGISIGGEAREDALRPAAKIYLAMVVAAAVGVLLVAVDHLVLPSGDVAILAFALVVALAGTGLAPLPFVARTKLCLDSAILLVAVLALPPSLAVLVVAAGAIIGPLILRHPLEQAAFNTALMVVLAVIGSGAAVALGWQAGQLTINGWSLLTAIGIGCGLWLANTLLVATMIAFQEAEPLRQVISGMVVGGGTATLTQLAEVAIGVMLVALAASQPPVAFSLLAAAAVTPVVVRQLGRRPAMVGASASSS